MKESKNADNYRIKNQAPVQGQNAGNHNNIKQSFHQYNYASVPPKQTKGGWIVLFVGLLLTIIVIGSLFYVFKYNTPGQGHTTLTVSSPTLSPTAIIQPTATPSPTPSPTDTPQPTATPTTDMPIVCGGNRVGGDVWTFAGDGPPDCHQQAWDTTTKANPTSIYVDYPVGPLPEQGTYTLYVYITASASANTNYDPEVNGTVIEPCPHAPQQPGWREVCTFKIGEGDVGQTLDIHEWTGVVTAGLIMSDSAVDVVFGDE